MNWEPFSSLQNAQEHNIAPTAAEVVPTSFWPLKGELSLKLALIYLQAARCQPHNSVHVSSAFSLATST